MDLVALAKNPAPSGATTGIFKMLRRRASCALRAGMRRGARGAAPCACSRAAASSSRSISRWSPTCAGAASPWPPWTGAARAARARLLANPRKGYVRSFAEFDQDLAHFMKEIVLPDCPPPFIALAHSMGGHILLRNAALPGSWFSRMVLSAPMIAIAEEQARRAACRSSRAYAEILGRPRASARMYVRGGDDEPMELDPFEGNPLTSDRERYQRNRLVLEAAPRARPRLADRRLAARRLRSIARLTAPDYPLRVEVPLLLFAAGMDTHRLDAGDRGVRAAPEGRHARADPAVAPRDPAGDRRDPAALLGRLRRLPRRQRHRRVEQRT